jgi:hypothetical protein
MENIKYVLYEISCLDKIIVSYIAKADNLPTFEETALNSYKLNKQVLLVRTSVYALNGMLEDSQEVNSFSGTSAMKILNDFSEHLIKIRDRHLHEPEPVQIELLQ